jgi:hypothetical protein
LTFKNIRKLALVPALLGALVFAACGESAQEKAKAQVCGARNEIQQQITKLQGLTFSSNTLNEAKAAFEAIGKELTKIKDAQSGLAPARKEQVQTATSNFETQLSSVAGGVVSSLGSTNLETALKNAEPQLKSALSKLAADYKQSLGPISCS